jgi:hypothetical protein
LTESGGISDIVEAVNVKKKRFNLRSSGEAPRLLAKATKAICELKVRDG